MELEFEKAYRKFLMPRVRGSDKGAKKRYGDPLPEEVQKRVANSVLAMGGLFQRKSTQDTKKALTEVLNMRSEPETGPQTWRRRQDGGSE